MGVNGAGKTTLLKLVGGLLYPTAGSIHVDGFDTIRQSNKAKSSVGFVLNEERSFYWRLSGVQNMEFFAALDNLHGTSLRKKIDYLLGLVGLDEAGSKLFANYSSGMKQRLAIARGLIADPSILILDEPTRTLDPVATRDIKDILLDRVHSGRRRTLLIATHSLSEAEALCNKICFMKKGRILLFADVGEIVEKFGSIENCYAILFENHNLAVNHNEINYQNDIIIESL
jgi:ABC-2 type transport system ATP-binding protein